MNFNNQKRNFERYLGTRKYKLSFWGFNPHIDWLILISYLMLGFVAVIFYAVLEFKEVEESLNQAIVSEVKREDFDYKKVNSLVDSYLGIEESSVDEIPEEKTETEEVDQTQ